MSVPASLPKIFSELGQWRQCARHLYYREMDGKKYGVVLATIAPSRDRPALNKPEIERVLAGKRRGTIDEGYVVAARLNGVGYEYLGASLAEIVAKKLEGRVPLSGRYGEFWTLDLWEIDHDEDRPL